MRTSVLAAAALALAALIATAAALADSMSSLWTAARGNLMSVLAAVTFVVVLAGCGGGDEGGSKAEEEVSKQEFIGKADAICTEANEKREAVKSPQLSVDNPGVVVRYARTMNAAYGDALTKLKRLEVPRKDEETIKTMVAKFAQALTWSDDVVAAAHDRDSAGIERAASAWAERAIEGQNIAHKYGLKECSRFGTP